MITFIKVLAYPLTPAAGDVFSYLDDVTTQRVDPSSLHPGELALSQDVIYHSPLRRAYEALAPEARERAISCPALREIPFSLATLCTSQEWKHEKSIVVRRRFKEAFIADRLLISRAVIESEIQEVMALLTSRSSAAVVSHSFRLKLIEGYIKTQGELFRDPHCIHDWIFDEHKTYAWGEGFSLDTISVDGYTASHTA